jgi:hypothetical protein
MRIYFFLITCTSLSLSCNVQLKSLSDLPALPNLVFFGAFGLALFDVADTVTALARMPNLRKLVIGGTVVRASPDFVQRTLQACPHLRWLDGAFVARPSDAS